VIVVVLSLVYLSSVFADRACTANDYIPQYTACDSRGFRNVIYYLNPQAQCTIGTYQPQNLFNLPCNISCSAGEYLPIGATTCAPCLAGQFSLGGGIRLSEWSADFAWDSWEPQGLTFRTFCLNNTGTVETPGNCTGWRIENGFIYSGDTDDDKISILELGFRLVAPGYIRFLYQVDAERGFDGLRFVVNGVIVMPTTSTVPDYVEFQHYMGMGVHTVQWQFIKDATLSRGDDNAAIKSIEIKGMSYADDYCSLCPRGYSSVPRSSECQICPTNTKAPQEGSPQCTPCQANEYSYPGSIECLRRPPCTETDYEISYTPCRDPGVRDMLFGWSQPKICDEHADGAIELPPTQTDVGCAACNAGFYRPAIDSVRCFACPTNTWSGPNAIRCRSCEAGQVAPRQFIMESFEEWPSGVATNCTGDCGTSGWRLRYDHIDSGEGHGRYASVQFGFNVTLEEPGELKFKYQFNCSSYCTLLVSSAGKFSRSFYSMFYNDEITERTLQLAAGEHKISFYFQEYDDNLQARDDKIRIYSVRVTNVIEGQGGAETCESCLSGTYASTEEARCIECGPGRYSNTSEGPVTECTTCPANTFAEGPRSAECSPCGYRTTSTEGSSECYTNCTFSIGTHDYDLNPLRKSDSDMYGPIYDTRNNHAYFLNVCTKQHSNHSCFDREGRPIPSFACQITSSGYGVDLGHVIGFGESVNNGPRNAFVVRYTHGTLGCAGPNNSSPAFPRSTTVNFLCDDQAGIGYPEPADGGIERSSNPCQYFFKWRTAYACPLCTVQDYTYYYTECKSGFQSKVYTWKNSPKVCHDGVSLPATEQNLPCADNDKMICKPGEHKVEVCEGCPTGQFSVGGGNIWQDWNSLPEGFTPSCQGQGCTNWQPKGSVLVSGSTGSSVTLVVNFVRPGAVRTQFFGLLIFGRHLTISLDDQVVAKLSESSFEGTEHNLPIEVGTHKITWTYSLDENAPANRQDMGYVAIQTIIAEGTKWNDGSCTKCRPGSHQPYTNSTTCLECPRDTYQANEGRFECTSCPGGTYAPKGSSTPCFNKEACTENDYIPVFTQCKSGFYNQTYVLKRPVICKETSSYRPPAPQVAACTCPTGQFTNAAGLCESCQPGYSFVEGQCKQAQRGSAAILVKDLFPRGRTSAGISCASDTGCSGACRTSWRLHPEGISSGIQTGPAISHITIPIEMAIDGSLNIHHVYINPPNQPKNFFQVYVDGILAYHTAVTDENIVVPLQRDSKNIAFIWHQNTVAEAVVAQATITGATDGIPILRQCQPGTYSSTTGATTCTPCAPGTAAVALGSTQCLKCEENTFAATSGMAKCLACGSGSFSTKGSSFCQTTCNFTIGDNQVNLNGLKPMTVETVAGNRYLISLCEILDSSDCVDEKNTNLHTHVCVTRGNTKRGVDYGKNFNFAPLATDNGVHSLNVTLDYGEECYSPDPTQPIQFKKSFITFYCDINKGVGEPVLNTERTKFTDQCEDLYFDWYTAHACRVCKFPEDFENLGSSDCKDKRATVSYGPKGDCFNSNYPTPYQQEEDCTPQGFSTIGVVIGITVFILLVAILATGFLIVYMKNRKLSAQYSLLNDAHANRLDVALDDSDNEL
jgi:hypothetical protein